MQLVIYVLLYPILYFISILPFRLLYAFSDFLYLIIYRVFGYRKKVVFDNLKLVYPNKTKKELKQIAKLFYHHLCDMMVESIKSITISEKSMKSHFTFKNISTCPDCGSSVMHEGGCATCPSCGFSKCE